MSVYIKQLSKEDEKNQKLFDFISNLPVDDSGGFRNPWHYTEGHENFSEWIDLMLKIDKGEYIVEREAKQHSIYWIYIEQIPIGIGKIRQLTEEEKKFAGHIGYYIAPPYRGKGFATEVTKLLIAEAKQNKNIEKVIISIEPENLASRRIAEKCGAKLEKIIENVAYKYTI